VRPRQFQQRQLGRCVRRCDSQLRSCTHLLIAWAVVAVAACSPDDDSHDALDGRADAGADADDSIAVVVGGGSDTTGKGFIDWSDGVATAPMIRGGQGGQHVWVTVRTHGLWPTKTRLNVTMTLIDTGIAVKPGTVPLMPTLHEIDANWHEVESITAYVKCPCQVAGRRIRVDVEAIDLYGLTGNGSATITPTWDGDCSQPPSGNCGEQ
jgi:hypothetical protein